MFSQKLESTPSFRPENDRPVPQDLFVCPMCKGGLRNAGVDAIVCTICGLRFRQTSKDYVNLLPDDLWQPHADCWSERQHEMEEWYRELIAEPIAARDILIEHDYKPYARVLATFSGTVLDLGGGAGFTRQFLGADVRYIVADPSLDWLAPDWQRIAEPGFASGETPSFVRAVGEHLPFPDQMFDAVLALWSLNHCARTRSRFPGGASRPQTGRTVPGGVGRHGTELGRPLGGRRTATGPVWCACDHHGASPSFHKAFV